MTVENLKILTVNWIFDMDKKTRSEHDSMGRVKVPLHALYGAQTQRAVNNFTISAGTMPDEFLRALLMIKLAAAETNHQLNLLDDDKAAAIKASILELLDTELEPHFPVSVLQTGSGTSTNMNANEVISSLAERHGVAVSPNDHVNMGQSSNDVIPSALLVATALELRNRTIPSLGALAEQLRTKAGEYHGVIKTGRTHLMDALPIRLDQELGCWASQVDDCRIRLENVLTRVARLPLGGTAIGSGVNCHPDFPDMAIMILSQSCGFEFQAMNIKYKAISSIDTPLEVSGQLKTAACCLMKISNDLRWMNSGPLAGLHEIRLPPLQPGSSIMPDKVNPVIPEAVCMAAAKVIGNDTTITVAAQSGNFQLNTMLPVTAACLIESSHLIGNAADILAEKAIRDMVVNISDMQVPLEKNPILVTALTPIIGYKKSAAIGRKARLAGKSVLEVAVEETDIDYKQLSEILDPKHLADGKFNK